MADLAGIPDVEHAWRTLTDAETLVAATRLTFASAIVRQEVSDVDSRILAGSLDAALVAGVVADMVIRVLRNPEGWSQQQYSIDDYSETNRRDEALSDGSLYLTQAERALLMVRLGGAFTIVPSYT